MKLIDIKDRENLDSCLSKLQVNNVPNWGSLTSLQMLEYLVVTIEYTNGKKKTKCSLTNKKLKRESSV